MVRYFCGECFEDHDNARDCPHYSKVGKSYERGQKVANNMKKRGKMKNNNYADPENAPEGCLKVIIPIVIVPSGGLIYLALEVLKWIA